MFFKIFPNGKIGFFIKYVEGNTSGTDDSQVVTYGAQTSAGTTGVAGASQTSTGGGGNDAGVSVLMSLNLTPFISA